MKLYLVVALLSLVTVIQATPKKVKVFIALCDNKTQAIYPVNERIGNGDKPDANLYWGCSDGFGAYFKKSNRWKITKSTQSDKGDILRSMTLQHISGTMHLEVLAYRGSKMKQYLAAFESDACGGQYDLVAFIGHNGLMEMSLNPPQKNEANKTDIIVLACLSENFFGKRLRELGCNTVLMTQSLMYPGSFILHDALEAWNKGGSKTQIREAAAKVYAKNQKISVKSARNIFAPAP